MATTCPKCDGNKSIEAFGHIAGGLCFCCGGSGVVEVKAGSKPSSTVDANHERQVAWMSAATVDQVRRMTWKQLHAARQFCLARNDELAKRWEAKFEAIYRQEAGR